MTKVPKNQTDDTFLYRNPKTMSNDSEKFFESQKFLLSEFSSILIRKFVAKCTKFLTLNPLIQDLLPPFKKQVRSQ